ncbi:MAG: response regulator [Desulfuromonadales bacterium]|nr:response regulator [Desulfuromonadales bacterium]
MDYRTIIIEDDETIRDLLKLAAELQGHEVFTFPNPTVFPCPPGKTCPPGILCSDIIISDQLMPGMTGLEFFAQLKKKKCSIRNKALITALDKKEVKGRADELGLEFIPKPFKVNDIISLLLKYEANSPKDRQLIPREEIQNRLGI